MRKLKLALAILVFVLLCFMSSVSAIPYHDGHSHSGIGDSAPFRLVATCDLPLVHTFPLLQFLRSVVECQHLWPSEKHVLLVRLEMVRLH